ncbi:MAG: Ig-like domain-containing protein, partial [Lachnospiraceae bacterium]
YGSKKKTVKVHVVSKKKKAKKVTLNKKSVTIKKGETLTLKATVTPKQSTDFLTWSSSNKKIVKVDKYGQVTALKKGKTKITVKTSSGKKASCSITVK